MSNNQNIIRELDQYCEVAKVAVSTVCRKATGDPRLRDRLAYRIEKTDADIEALRKFMADNPVPISTTEPVDSSDHVQGHGAGKSAQVSS